MKSKTAMSQAHSATPVRAPPKAPIKKRVQKSAGGLGASKPKGSSSGVVVGEEEEQGGADQKSK